MLFLLILRPPTKFTPYPNTTPFRSGDEVHEHPSHDRDDDAVENGDHPSVRGKLQDHGVLHAPRHEPDEQEQPDGPRSEEHTSELQSPCNLVCRLLLEIKIN